MIPLALAMLQTIRSLKPPIGGENFMSDLSQLRELVARSCRVLGKLNLTRNQWPRQRAGARSDKILIKARGPEESGLRFVTLKILLRSTWPVRKWKVPMG